MNAPAPGSLPTSVISPTPTWPIDRKVWAGGLGGLAAAGLGLLLRHFGLDFPPDVLSFVVVAAYGAVSYLVPPSVRDVVGRVNNAIVKLANADPSNQTQAVVVDLATSKIATAKDIASGAVPAPAAMKGT